jgi:hypothetical protein
MSTIDDLRNELAKRAEDVPSGHHIQRLSGIRRKRAAHRRRLTGAVAAASALAVAAVVALVPGNAPEADPAPPAAQKPGKAAAELPGAPIPVVEESGVELYETPGLATLNGYAVGEAGQQQVEFSFVAGSSVLSYTSFCTGGPKPNVSLDEAVWISITVNGQLLPRGTCSSAAGSPQAPTMSLGDSSYEQQAEAWASVGVRTGERVEAVARLTDADGRASSDPDVAIGAAFWSKSNDQHHVTPSTVVDDLVEFAGVNYNHVTTVSTSVSEGGSLPVWLDQGSETPMLVHWGYVGSGGVFTLQRAGGRATESLQDHTQRGGGASKHLLRSADSFPLRVIAERLNSGEVTLWAALYEPVQ